MMNVQPPVDATPANSQYPPFESQSDCSTIQALIPDYAFGLTDKIETQWVETHLDQCAEAVAALADFRQMQTIMRADVPQIEPPPQLGQRLMAMAAMTAPAAAPRTSSEPTSTPPAPLLEPVIPLAIVSRPNVKVMPSNRVNRWAWLLAAAVILLVLSNAYWLVRVNSGAAINGSTTAANATVSSTNAGLVVNTTSTLRWVHLPASQQSGKASAYLMWNAESKIGLLYVHDFPVLAAGQTYQLWLTRGAAHLSVGTFTVDQNGKGALLFSTEAIDQYTWARITTEPKTGSDTPDGTIVVVGQL